MNIQIRGASEHNLKNIDVQFGDGLTVVTGVSGSGKTSLVFDTLHHEAYRRFLDVFLYGRSGKRLAPAKVEAVTGVGPTIAVGQNLLNRNPLSTLATASGLHPFLRLLYSNYGVRHCLQCGSSLSVLTEDEIVDRLVCLSKQERLNLSAPLLLQVKGSHTTLLKVLTDKFGEKRLLVDGELWDAKALDSNVAHDIEIEIGRIDKSMSAKKIREAVQEATALGAGAIKVCGKKKKVTLATTPICNICGAGFRELEPTHFNRSCPYCKSKGCERCDQTGMHPQAASVLWEGMRLPELLALSVDEVQQLFLKTELPSTANRLRSEIQRRLDALERVGLGYISLDRPAPSLSRGESQRVRLAISLSSRLEDTLHVLDEPTIGQHPADVARFLPAFRDLAGPVVYVEHDRVAAAEADRAIDLGPGAGKEGGEVIFTGSPAELWKANTSTGRYFSLRDRVMTPEPRPPPDQFLLVRGAHQHNLKHIDVKLPIGRLTVITGVSGSGKSTFVEHVLVPTLTKKKSIGCEGIEGPSIKPVIVDQSPIGKNPRSNPATYTKLSDIIRDLYAEATGLSKSHFSFNRPEGACPTCKGIGATEIKMRYLPSLWIPCADCGGQRFNEEVLAAVVEFGDQKLSIADFYALSIQEIVDLISRSPWLSSPRRKAAQRILRALIDIGLGYLELGQPSPTLSGGEAQRVKLAKHLGRNKLSNQLIVLDEPSTGLHPQDLNGLLKVLDRLVRSGATIVIVEHNTDIIRAADWIIDLGPGAGPRGGEILYAGPSKDLCDVAESITGSAIKGESAVQPRKPSRKTESPATPVISIRNAKANNLKGVDVDIPKGTLTVVTGVSGSGKSSLIRDVLQTEARRRYLESVSMFERQGVRESSEAPVDIISGLGVVLTVAPHRAHLWSHIPQFTRRNSVGAISELSFHVANLLASLGERQCLECGARMKREKTWVCPRCDATASIAKARHFSGAYFASSCGKCSGLGSFQAPQTDKLIIHPEKPLCGGAMWSPGYWPKTYLCKDQPVIPALGERYGFNPFKTPWNEMPKEAQNAFLFGDDETYVITYQSKSLGPMKGKLRTHKWKWRGFFGKDSWLWDWDIHGTYTKTVVCPECNGKGLLPEFLAVTLQGRNIYELSEMALNELEELLKEVPTPPPEIPLAETSLNVARRRLRFLRQVGLGYLHLNRPTGTLSTGEAQRIQLASLLGSGLTSLTILIDEPSRGMHPSELEALRGALQELRDEGNTVIVIEHDLLLIRAADHVIDLGPGAGALGGEIVAEGAPDEIVEANTVTSKWLQDDTLRLTPKKRSLQGWIWPNQRRKPQGWMEIRGARANNLRGEHVKLPLGTLIGVCGVSGSGKSTLLIDTLGRALVKKSHSSSFAREPVQPGAHDSIKNAPQRAFIVDQSLKGIRSPAIFLGLIKPVQRIYADSDDAQALGMDDRVLSKRCSVCGGRGRIRIVMGFLPDEYVECETCRGTGYQPEAWEVRFKGVALPEINAMTLDEVCELFKDEDRIAKPLNVARQVGLGYLVWNQPAYTLSSGEVQRLKIAKELYKRTENHTLYISDEPTVGLHMEDVAQLVEVLNQLVDAGHTVVVVEHHPHVLANCDWLIELGPSGGPEGGKVIAEGSPEEVARMGTPTAPYLRKVLGMIP
ncbi:MAG: ATP-binding cassette domain-containing protein [Candidatus Bathyarchaeota archaeon]|jgi:excinuclease ABC subunit A